MADVVNPNVQSVGSQVDRISPGAVNIKSIYLIGKNRQMEVSRLMFKLNMYENIMSPVITGSITFHDTINLLEGFPLLGEETLAIDMETPGFEGPLVKRSGIFHVYKMEERENATMKGVLFTLHFMSVEGFTDMNTKVSQTFRGKVSDIAKKMISANTGLASHKKAIVEETVNNDIYTSNFWTPVENLYYLITRAINKNNNPNYVFFENQEGFVFASIDSLYAMDPVQEFWRDQYSRMGRQVENPDMEYRKVLDMSTPVMYDYIEKQQQGFYGASMYNFDIETKRLNFVARVAKDDFKKVNLNETEAIGEGMQFHPYGVMFNQVINRNLYNGSPVVPIDHSIRRMSLLKRAEAMKTNIQVFGRFDYTVGRTIDLYVTSDKEITETSQDIYDKVLSGRYLITALNHEITGGGHMTYLEISKDSISRKVENKA